MSSPDTPRPDTPDADPRDAGPFTPPSAGTAGTFPPPYGQPGQAPYGQPAQAPYGQPAQAPYGQPAQAPYGQPGTAGPYTAGVPGGAPWEQRPGGRPGLSGGKIALIVVAALVAVVLLLVGALALARNVGGLTDGGGPVGGGDAVGYGDDAVLDELWDRCEAGDGGACDDLFWDSPVDSEYEDFGNTCGGRFEHGPWSCEGEI